MTSSNETTTSAKLRLAASREGARLWRNNVGAGMLLNGSYLRWGLANETPEMNRHMKSGDLIGIRPVLISHEHVGQMFGQFVSREMKREGWHYKGDDHERAQQAWIDLVRSLGGDAAFSTGEWT